MAISFGGSSIGRPGAFSVVDTSDMIPLTVGAQKVLAFVGEAKDANVETDVTKVLYFNSPKHAREALGTGSLLKHMETAWKHGADLIAVSVVKGSGALGALQDEDWDSAIDRFETETVHAIIPVSTSGAVQVKVDTHNSFMSNVTQRKERRGFYGHEAGLDVTAIKALKTSLNGERVVFASPAVYTEEASGRVLQPSTILASAYAGIWAKLEPQVPITYKYVSFAGLERKYTGVEIADLLSEGVAVTEHVEGKGLRIVQGVTGATGTKDLTQVELSVSYIKDLTSQNLREQLEDKFTGQAGVAGIETSIHNYIGTILDEFVRQGWIRSYDPQKVNLIRFGTTFDIEWEGSPTLPINNFLITSRFKL